MSESESADFLDRTSEFYSRIDLQDDMLTKVDPAAMMVFLGSRAVFLDNDGSISANACRVATSSGKARGISCSRRPSRATCWLT